MYSKGFKTILLFLALGFLAIWVLEFRRTTLVDSYWALLLVLLCLLWYQLINLKLIARAKKEEVVEGEKRRQLKSKEKKKK
jgi:amino acid permease